MNTTHETGRNDTRNSLLDELESIRSLLKEHSEDNRTNLRDTESARMDIPVLHDAIPVLHEHAPSPDASIPMLDDRVNSLGNQIPRTPVIPATATPDTQMDTVRAAAAIVAARAVRSRTTDTATRLTGQDTPPTKTTHLAGELTEAHERLIADVINELRPQFETLLRRVLLEKLTAPASNQKGTP